MAITIKMHNDIRKKKSKFLGPFTFRQCVCIVLGVAFAVPIVKPFPFDIYTKLIIGAILAIPIVLCGFISRDGQYFEVILARWVYKMILTPQKRKKKLMSYTKLRKKLRHEKEQEIIKQLPVKERKAYIKAHKNGKKQLNYKTQKASTRIYR